MKERETTVQRFSGTAAWSREEWNLKQNLGTRSFVLLTTGNDNGHDLENDWKLYIETQ